MKFSARTTLPGLLTAVLLIPGIAPGHGDNELPLYVAEGGEDTGDCVDSANPCASISYALSRSGKGSRIQVGSGTYAIERPEDIFDLVNGSVTISGGGRFDAAAGTARGNETVLHGIPFQYRDMFEGLGFRMVADSKGISAETMAAADNMLSKHSSLKSSIAATPCVGGSAAGLPCTDVDLLSHVSFGDVSANPSAGNDIWGFVDLNTGREYALVGFSHGTGVFDVTDATSPREVGFVDGQAEIWRDIKVYQFFDPATGRWKSYAYVTTDGSTTDGLVVIDMTELPHFIRRVNYPSDFLSAHNVYATNTDYSTGLSLTGATPTLIIAGSNVGNGRYRQYSLNNPEAPAFIAGGTGSGYMHDASSIIITDSRKDTQCVNGTTTHCEIVLDFNENMIEIWDVTNPSTPAQLSATPYSNWGYVHSGWWSEDKQTIYVHDELDERDRGLATTLRTFSVADLRAPMLSGTWTGPTNAIDHNGFVRGNRYYMSNYTRGLTVLDITSQSSPVAVGRIDTYPAHDLTRFNGAWGAYPYFYSGNIAVSDIDSGFYMVADQTRDVAAGRLEFTAASYAVTEGQQAQLNVRRFGQSNGAISVDYELLHATANGSDYTGSGGTLTWNDGDGGDKAIAITVVNDGVAESLERLIVRLVNPTGGATLGNVSTASSYISDPGATSEINFLESQVAMPERGFATAVVVATRSGSASGAVSVDLGSVGNASPGVDFTGNLPATLNWADGDAEPKMFELSIVDDGAVESDESMSFTLVSATGATIGANDSFQVIIQDGAGGNLAPNAIAGTAQTVPSGATVTLNAGQSNDPDGDIISYDWVQTGGQTVTLENAGTSTPTFTAPVVSSDTMLQFRVTVQDPGGLSDSASTTVTVMRPVGSPPVIPGGGSGSTGVLFLVWLLALVSRRQISRKDLA